MERKKKVHVLLLESLALTGRTKNHVADAKVVKLYATRNTSALSIRSTCREAFVEEKNKIKQQYGSIGTRGQDQSFIRSTR